MSDRDLNLSPSRGQVDALHVEPRSWGLYFIDLPLFTIFLFVEPSSQKYKVRPIEILGQPLLQRLTYKLYF